MLIAVLVPVLFVVVSSSFIEKVASLAGPVDEIAVIETYARAENAVVVTAYSPWRVCGYCG